MESMKLLLKNKVLFLSENPRMGQFVFWVILLATIIFDLTVMKGTNVFGLYYLCFIFVGIVFWRSCLACILLATALFTFRNVLHFDYIPRNPNQQIQFAILALQYAINLFPVLTISYLLEQSEHQQKQTLATIVSLSKTLEQKDQYTALHSENVASYALMIAKKLKLSSTACHNIRMGGLLHDIGKIGVPEVVLTKRGRLTEKEFSLIQEHPVIGHDILGGNESFQRNGILDMVLHHHERYDGTGYPSGLKGEEIPFFARIICVADSFDAMMTKRNYRDELDINVAIQELRTNSGTQFDTKIVTAFLEVLEDQRRVIKSLY